mmetsp:Transcript_49840/g.115736  ORF Transcript_49840/g.115736 Transcript_49840/m.115736 type:complete len:296 (-) Transcript_49840:62-949(-)|eukprot:CAMPEP_0171099792 /NCGR_PEP_ID=MMETSP0766_2-20121228/52573_1 /TAXON_ID=439317 /ORGANISM="Gambierdiscus australes, Strain CAWD 149" /LENGTH=295 /DNA_ID=CAMNT_0011559501 /DNA_START=135 /DNA_END=1022 /DNA_ORIENTATION=-
MAFLRDHGTCCVVLPLKLGVGITTMVAFSHSILCILALLTNDIRFQANGYSATFYSLPSAIGAVGLLVGFIGLLGVYDDKPLLLKVFNYWLAAKIIAMIVAALADFYMLRKCDSWMNTTEHVKANNVQLERLAEQHVCPWARWAYAVGASIDILFWCYLLVRSFSFQLQLEANPAYAIDFGRERFDKEARWRLYQVKDPGRAPKEQVPFELDQSNSLGYGSTNEHQGAESDGAVPYVYEPDGGRRPVASDAAVAGGLGTYNPDGTQGGASYDADGTRMSNGLAPAPRDAAEMQVL